MSRHPRPNILLIVLDTLRADRMSCYGHPQSTTPNLDAFAEKSTLFERAISPAQWTIPAHASIFTGTYPSTHLTHQIYDKHSPDYVMLAETLSDVGYRAVGFCNNPLLGVVDNELDRGFAAFYNYGGAFPQRPAEALANQRWLKRLLEPIKRWLNRVNGPAQQILTHNEFVLGLMLHPWLVPLWERRINFKGDTRLSLDDMLTYLRTYETPERTTRPHFIYLNLMETHLPYGPPQPFAQKFAPITQSEPEALDFLRAYNSQTYRWITPVTEPFSPLQHRALNEMYNAEVAYEDHLLKPLLDYLDRPAVRDNTLVIITSDHGEGLDHHDFVGHSLVTYEDLVHVPLIVRYPRRFPEGHRVATPVSTRRIFHTILEAAGLDEALGEEVLENERYLSLSHTANAESGSPTVENLVFTEAYPPNTMITLMEKKDPQAIEAFRCRATRRALYAAPPHDDYKLISVDGQADELFDLSQDPGELHNLLEAHPDIAQKLYDDLQASVAQAEAARLTSPQKRRQLRLKDNPKLAERLRGLGYIH